MGEEAFCSLLIRLQPFDELESLNYALISASQLPSPHTLRRDRVTTEAELGYFSSPSWVG